MLDLRQSLAGKAGETRAQAMHSGGRAGGKRYPFRYNFAIVDERFMTDRAAANPLENNNYFL